MALLQVADHQLVALVVKLTVGHIAGDDGRQAGGGKQHEGHHNLIFDRFHRVDAGEDQRTSCPAG